MLSKSGKIRVLIVDDHRVFADALSVTLNLERDMEVVGVATGVAEATAVAADKSPDVIIMDYRLPDGTGADAAQEIARTGPGTRVIVLTSYNDEAVLLNSMRAGVSGFLSKTEAVADVANAVRAAYAGDMRLPVGVLQRLLTKLSEGSPLGHASEQLSIRELDVLRLMAEGKDNADIGELLSLSRNTVRTHVQNILGKLGVHSKLAAVAAAVRRGIIEPPGQS